MRADWSWGSLASRWTRHPFLAFGTRVTLILVTFVVVERVTASLTYLPADSFERPFLFVEALRHLGAARVLVAVGLFAALVVYGRLWDGWSSWDPGGHVRPFVGVLALATAWMFSAYGYNYYLGQGHYVDRGLVILLWALVWFRPCFVLPFVPLAFALLGQTAVPPLGGTFLAHPLQILHVLNLFTAAWLVFAVTGRRNTDAFVFLSACLVAGSYWVSGLAKLRMGWLTFGRLDLMPLTAYANGWLAFLEPSAVVSISSALTWLDWPMRLGVAAMEVACLAFLWRRSVAIFLLAAAIAFHLGVFLFNGFLFWNWMLLDAALLALLAAYRPAATVDLFNRRYLPLSVLLIGLAGVWADLPRLAWFDTPLTTTYPLEAVGKSGARYTLPPTYFAPFQDVFTMSSFAYLTTDHPVLTGPYGVTFDLELAHQLVAATSAEQVFQLEAAAGPAQPDAARRAQFEGFLRRFIGNRQRQGEPSRLAVAIRPARLYWSFDSGNVYRGQEPIDHVIILERTLFFDGDSLDMIRQLEIGRVGIP